MAGGTWNSQNKTLPGAYVNTIGKMPNTIDSDRGIVLLADGVKHDWGKNGVIELDSSSDIQSLLGTSLDDDSNKALAATLRQANQVLYVNLNDGVKAANSDENLPWKFTAKYAGNKGNDITIDVIKALNGDAVTIKFIFGTKVTSTQTIKDPSQLMGDGYVDVAMADSASDKFSKIAGEKTYTLTGGTSNYPSDITEMLSDALDTRIFDVVTTAGYPVDSNIHSLVAQMVTDLREKQGYHITGVIPATFASNYNYEGITALINGVVMEDGTELDTSVAAGFVAGASANVPFDQSLTYAKFPNAVDTLPRLSLANLEQATKSGKMAFANLKDGSVVIEQDINTLNHFTDTKPTYFAKNRVIRTLDYIANDTREDFENSFIGKVSNNASGRDLFKASRVKFLKSLNDSGIIENFSEDDISIHAGNDKDSLVVDLSIQPTDSMEKLYMTVNVE